MTAEPDSKVLLISGDLEFLVLATDGLWEKVWMNSQIHMHGFFFFSFLLCVCVFLQRLFANKFRSVN